jgi:hypothetical protein
MEKVLTGSNAKHKEDTMQANTITVSVPTSSTVATPVGVTFARSREELDKSTYVGPDNSLDARQWMQFYRTAPKRSGESRGTAKSAIKLTDDQSVPNASGSGNIVLPLITELSISVPVGTSYEAVYRHLEVIEAMLASQKTAVMALMASNPGEI